MKNSKCLVFTLAAGLATAGLSVFNSQAAESPDRSGPFRGQLLERAKEKLNLADDQVAKIKDAINAEKEPMKNLTLRLYVARRDLGDAISAPNATEASVRAASAKVAAVESDLAVERMKLRARINPILTNDQRQKLKELQSKLDEFVDSLVSHLGDRLGIE